MPDEQDELLNAVRETEAEILNEAFQSEPKGDEAQGEQTETAERETAAETESQEQPRDEKTGQFAAKDKAKPDAQAEPQGEQEQPGQEDKGDAVPRWRLKEIADARRAAEAERDTLRAELARLQAQQPRQQQQPQTQQQEQIDPLLDPAGFADRLRSDFQRQLAESQLNMNLEMAHMRHGEVFEKAYEALIQEGQRGNKQLVTHLTAQRNPGEAIVSWHKQNELMRETKGDLQGFEKSLREKLLKDPEFIKAAMEAARGQAGGQPNGQSGARPNVITRLPPSLSRQAGSSPSGDPGDSDDSEASVFDYAVR